MTTRLKGTPVTRVTRARRDQGSDTRDELENCPPNARKTPAQKKQEKAAAAALEGAASPCKGSKTPATEPESPWTIGPEAARLRLMGSSPSKRQIC